MVTVACCPLPPTIREGDTLTVAMSGTTASEADAVELVRYRLAVTVYEAPDATCTAASPKVQVRLPREQPAAPPPVSTPPELSER
jgi:hypothetical protein